MQLTSTYFFTTFSSQTPDKNNEIVRKLEQDLELKTIEQTQQRQDYEDLLVLLEDQDSKIRKFKVSVFLILFKKPKHVYGAVASGIVSVLLCLRSRVRSPLLS